MNLRPVTLNCDNEVATVVVRQQPHPLEALTPDHWITTVQVGDYPNQIHLVWQTPTRDEGLDRVRQLGNDIFNGIASALAVSP